MQAQAAENGTAAEAVVVDFHDKYLTVCRRRNAQPLAAVCKGRAQSVLDVCADRVRLDEWLHVLRALRDDQRLAAVAIRLRKRRTMGGFVKQCFHNYARHGFVDTPMYVHIFE